MKNQFDTAFGMYKLYPLRRMPQPRQARDDNARISVEIGETPEKIGAFVQKPVVKREKL